MQRNRKREHGCGWGEAGEGKMDVDEGGVAEEKEWMEAGGKGRSKGHELEKDQEENGKEEWM